MDFPSNVPMFTGWRTSSSLRVQICVGPSKFETSDAELTSKLLTAALRSLKLFTLNGAGVSVGGRLPFAPRVAVEDPELNLVSDGLMAGWTGAFGIGW
eukprot:m.165907 g.165907  ORF g.165907 m.165907 type:complete len:98 (+) comp38903_c0_seq29:3339-3632(+)